MNKQELQELSMQAHSNAKEKGFWADKLSHEHYLMLVLTEVAELVEAHRGGLYANLDELDNAIIQAKELQEYSEDWLREVYPSHFEACIKNTIADEFADIAIRLLDLAGALGLNFERIPPCNYFRAFDRFIFTENAFALCKGLSRSNFAVEKRVLFGLNYVQNWADNEGVDLLKHI